VITRSSLVFLTLIVFTSPGSNSTAAGESTLRRITFFFTTLVSLPPFGLRRRWNLFGRIDTYGIGRKRWWETRRSMWRPMKMSFGRTSWGMNVRGLWMERRG